MSALTTQAIQAALKNDWKQAAKLNQEILKESPDNTDALNRLAFALSKTGDYDTAVKKYKKILKLDRYNPIAKKNLDKIKLLQAQKGSKNAKATMRKKDDDCPPISPSLFIADAQKTKIVKLINIAPRQTLVHICNGEEVFAVKRRFELQIKDKDNVYIGSFPDDIGHTFMKHIEANVPLKIYIKDIQDNAATVFVKF